MASAIGRKKSLWLHQREAIEMCTDFLAQRTTRSGALVSLPTGAGKSAVIAVVGAIAARRGVTLVACPSDALSKQLISDVLHGAWNTVAMDEFAKPSRVERLMPSDRPARLRVAPGERFILVSTMQAMAIIQRENAELYEELRQSVSTVLVDEGHREPAPTWARALRGLDKPMILFSATPYRNDLRQFNVDGEFMVQMSFDKASTLKIIRRVEVESLRLARTPYAFARSLGMRVQELEASGAISVRSKIIVHCETASSVTSIHDALLKDPWTRKQGVLAFHDSFTNAGPTKFLDVPTNLRQMQQRFLVHQYKLMEGIDDPSVQVLAMFEPLSNARSLVQQVGRIVRNPNRSRDPAYLLHLEDDHLSRSQWAGFCAFDAQLSSIPKTDRDVVANLIKALPPFDYFRGSFRKKVPDSFDIPFEKELKVRKSALVFHHPADTPSKGLDVILDEVRESLITADRWIARELSDGITDKNSKGHIFIAAVVKPSLLLEDSAFMEIKFAATLVRQIGDFLFISDSESGGFLDLEEVLSEGEFRLDLLLSGNGTRLTGMSAINSDVGPRSLRSRAGAGYNLAESAPYLADHQYVLRRIVGYAGSEYRSLGLARNRVASGRGNLVTVEEHAAWTHQVAEEIISKAADAPHPYVERFARPVDAPTADDAQPLHALLHIESLLDRYESDDYPGKDVADATELASNVFELPAEDDETGARHAFEIMAFGKSHEVYIKYLAKQKRYVINSPFLESFTNPNRPNETLVRALNARQAFQIIPASRDMIYTGRRFYKVDLSVDVGGRGRLLLDLMTPVPLLSTAHSEKGDIRTAPTGRWSNGSVFDLIDRGLQGHHGTPFGETFSKIACTDMGREIADFVAVEEDRAQIVFVHAKGGASLFSVSELHVVVAQAIKNLANVTAGSASLSQGLQVLRTSWRDKGRVRSRMRAGTRHAFVGAATRVSANPNSQREVWLALGGLLSKSSAEHQIRNGETSAESLQMFMLISSLYTQCVTVGSRLRIFCSP